MVNRKINGEKVPYMNNLILAFVLATILFIGIFALGYLISYQKYKNVVEVQETLGYDLLTFQVGVELLGDNCKDFDAFIFTNEMEDLGRSLSLLEIRFGKQDERVLEKKKVYSLLEARHFLYILEHNAQCSNDVNTILFFYSNQEKYKDNAERIGGILSALKNQEEVMIYSFDYDLDSTIVDLLIKKYGVDQGNRLVVNGRLFLDDYRNIKDVRVQLG
jgi:hypothetical protein